MESHHVPVRNDQLKVLREFGIIKSNEIVGSYNEWLSTHLTLWFSEDRLKSWIRDHNPSPEQIAQVLVNLYKESTLVYDHKFFRKASDSASLFTKALKEVNEKTSTKESVPEFDNVMMTSEEAYRDKEQMSLLKKYGIVDSDFEGIVASWIISHPEQVMTRQTWHNLCIENAYDPTHYPACQPGFVMSEKLCFISKDFDSSQMMKVNQDRWENAMRARVEKRRLERSRDLLERDLSKTLDVKKKAFRAFKATSITTGLSTLIGTALYVTHSFSYVPYSYPIARFSDMGLVGLSMIFGANALAQDVKRGREAQPIQEQLDNITRLLENPSQEESESVESKKKEEEPQSESSKAPVSLTHELPLWDFAEEHVNKLSPSSQRAFASVATTVANVDKKLDVPENYPVQARQELNELKNQTLEQVNVILEQFAAEITQQDKDAIMQENVFLDSKFGYFLHSNKNEKQLTVPSTEVK